MKCKNLYLVRHGARKRQLPDWIESADIPYDGPSYNVPISSFGELQAQALAERMADVPIDYIFSSPYRRSIQTAVPLAKIKKLPIKLEWGISELLKESWFKEFPTLPTIDEYAQEFPEVEFDATYQSVVTLSYPETAEEHYARYAETVLAITKEYGPNIFMAGHAGTPRHIRRALTDNEGTLTNGFCAISHIMREGDQWISVLDDDRNHLKEQGLDIPSSRRELSAFTRPAVKPSVIA